MVVQRKKLAAHKMSEAMIKKHVDDIIMRHMTGKGMSGAGILGEIANLFGFGYDDMKGSGFFSDFVKGFKKGFGAVISPAAKIASLIPIPEAQTAAKIFDVANKVVGNGLDEDGEGLIGLANRLPNKYGLAYRNPEEMEDGGAYRKYGLAYREPADLDLEDGGAYGLYVKKNRKSKKAKGSGLNRELGSGMEKKRGRPKTRKERAFDPNSKTARRAAKVREIMNKKHLSLIEASHYIKEHGISY